jgi:cell division protein FtsB
MNPFEMVVLIVAIVVIGRVLSNRYRGGRHGPATDTAAAAENARLRSEVQQLKDRVATLERIAIDKRSRLADEIDALGRD